jgi:hypothetical protein
MKTMSTRGEGKVTLDGDGEAALEAMRGVEHAVLHPTPPEKVGILLRDNLMSFVLVLEMAERYYAAAKRQSPET